MADWHVLETTPRSFSGTNNFISCVEMHTNKLDKRVGSKSQIRSNHSTNKIMNRSSVETNIYVLVIFRVDTIFAIFELCRDDVETSIDTLSRQ